MHGGGGELVDSRYSHISCPARNMTYRNMNGVNAGKKGTR